MTEHNPFCLLQELPPFDSPSKPEYNYCINDEYNFVLTPESQIKYNIKHLVNNSIYPIDEIRFTKLEFHTRYIDDMLNLDKNKYAQLIYVTCLNTLNSSIQATYNINNKNTIMLDIEIFKGPRYLELNLLDIKLYIKPMNPFLHIPYISFHPSFKPIIIAELTRYCYSCSSNTDYLFYKNNYFQQLLDRGYPNKLLKEYFSIVLDRKTILQKIISKKYIEYQENNSVPRPISFPLKRTLETLNLEVNNLIKFPDIISNNPLYPNHPTICYTNPPSLGSIISSNKCDIILSDAYINKFITHS